MRNYPAMFAVVFSGVVFALALVGTGPARADMALLAPSLTSFAAAEDVYMAQARRLGIQQLRASVAMYSEEAPIVMRDAPGGYIDYYNPPASSPAVVQTVSSGSAPETLAIAFLQEHADAFGLNSEHIAFAVQSVKPSGANSVVRLSQYYAGAPVFGASILVHVTPDGRIARVWTDTLRTLRGLDEEALAAAPTLTAQQATWAAADVMQAQLQERIAASAADIAAARDLGRLSAEDAAAAIDAVEETALEVASEAVPMVLDPLVLGLEGPPRRVWATTLRSTAQALVNEQVFVDAHTGEAALTVGQTKYAKSRWIADSDWQELELLGSPPATLRRAEGGPPVTGLQSPKSNEDVNLNYDALGQAYDYFYTNHGLDSFNGSGSELSSYVFWKQAPYAAWDDTDGYFMFGNGNYARADDIVGHEYTHAVLDRKIGLTNAGESAAIIESIANMWGEFIDWSVGGDSQTNRWQIGEDLTNGPIYHMDDPSQDVVDGRGRPSYMASSWWCDDDSDPYMPAINSGVGDKLIQLLTDGGTYNGCTVTGLGSTYVSDLFWEALENQIPASPTYVDLCQALFDAANDLSSSTPAPEVYDIQDAVEAVCLLTETYDYGYTPANPKSTTTLHIFESTRTADETDGYHRKKLIPYTIYVPEEDTSLGTRGTVTYPLDAIVLLPGGAMDRNVASGTLSDDGQTYIDGLARRWAKAGYIVICPTLGKRLVSGGEFWEWPYVLSPMARLLSDIVRVKFTNPEEFIVDRFRDAEFICDNLDSILNEKIPDCFSATESQIALAGYSWATPVVLLAAGATLDFPHRQTSYPFGETTTTIDLTEHGFSRIASGPSPYIDAAAFMIISGGDRFNETDFTSFDDTDPAFFGKDFIQRPLLVMMGGNDMVKDNSANGGRWPAASGFDAGNTDWMPAVTKAVGLNSAPSYGVVVDGANHVTPVSEFYGMASWDFGTFWTWLTSIASGMGGSTTTLDPGPQLKTSEEKNLFEEDAIADYLIDLFDGMFPEYPPVTEESEIDKLEVFETYSRSFWDVYLSPEYDATNSGVARAFLDLSNAAHTGQGLVLDDYGFDRSSPGAFTIRDDSGLDLVHFHNDGGILLLKGSLTTGATIAQTSAQEFIIRDTSGTIAAKVDASTGNLYIKGSLSENEPDLRTTSAHEFVVRNALEISRSGDADKARILLDASGNLKLVRKVYVATTP